MSHTMTLDKQMITNVAIGVGAATALYALYSFMDSTLTKRHEKLDEAEDALLWRLRTSWNTESEPEQLLWLN